MDFISRRRLTYCRSVMVFNKFIELIIRPIVTPYNHSCLCILPTLLEMSFVPCSVHLTLFPASETIPEKEHPRTIHRPEPILDKFPAYVIFPVFISPIFSTAPIFIRINIFIRDRRTHPNHWSWTKSAKIIHWRFFLLSGNFRWFYTNKTVLF